MGLLDRIQKIETPESVIAVSGIKYRIKGLSGLDASVLASRSERDSKKRKQSGLSRLTIDYYYLSECVSDAESGETLTPEQWAIVPRQHTAPIVVEVMKLNGLDDQDVERDPKESSTIAT